MRVDKDTEELIKRQVLLVIGNKVDDRLEMLVDHKIRSELVEIVRQEVSECIGNAVGKYVTAFLRKNH